MLRGEKKSPPSEDKRGGSGLIYSLVEMLFVPSGSCELQVTGHRPGITLYTMHSFSNIYQNSSVWTELGQVSDTKKLPAICSVLRLFT